MSLWLAAMLACSPEADDGRGREGPTTITEPSSTSSTTSTGDPTGLPLVPTAGITRRLSTLEVRNSLEALTGVVPVALERLPPDARTHLFERVASTQTVSRAHVEAWMAIGGEVATTLLAEQRLDELAPSCTDDILPPVAPSTTTHVSGASLSLAPEWAVLDTPYLDDPTHSGVLFAPDPTASMTHGFNAPGAWRVSLHVDIDGPIDAVEARLDGEVVQTFGPADGLHTYTFEAEVSEAGPHVLEWLLSTEPDFHNLRVEFHEIVVRGPADTGAVAAAAARQTCASELVSMFAPRAWRRPLTEAEADALLGLYDEGSVDGGPSGFTMLLQGILASPHFLYLVEPGTQVSPGVFALTDHELAARLSYGLCSAPPDDVLWSAAVAGAVHTEPQLAEQADRLLDGCGHDTVRRFLSAWLHLDNLETLNKSPEAFPDFDEDVKRGLIAERDRYLDEMVYGEAADLALLFTADFGWPDPRSDHLSGVEVTAQARTPLPATRHGVLTQPGLLAATAPFDETNPVHRGVFVIERLLCADLPPPPTDVEIAPPPPDPSLSTRERWARHSDDDQCAPCHEQVDPVGFLFEGYDGVGEWRTMDGEHVVDDVGGLPGLGYPDGTLEGVVELGEALAGTDVLPTCFATQWLRFTLGRLDGPQDIESIDSVGAVARDGTLRDALHAVVRTPSFTHRYGEAP